MSWAHLLTCRCYCWVNSQDSACGALGNLVEGHGATAPAPASHAGCALQAHAVGATAGKLLAHSSTALSPAHSVAVVVPAPRNHRAGGAQPRPQPVLCPSGKPTLEPLGWFGGPRRPAPVRKICQPACVAVRSKVPANSVGSTTPLADSTDDAMPAGGCCLLAPACPLPALGFPHRGHLIVCPALLNLTIYFPYIKA